MTRDYSCVAGQSRSACFEMIVIASVVWGTGAQRPVIGRFEYSQIPAPFEGKG